MKDSLGKSRVFFTLVHPKSGRCCTTAMEPGYSGECEVSVAMMRATRLSLSNDGATCVAWGFDPDGDDFVIGFVTTGVWEGRVQVYADNGGEMDRVHFQKVMQEITIVIGENIVRDNQQDVHLYESGKVVASPANNGQAVQS